MFDQFLNQICDPNFDQIFDLFFDQVFHHFFSRSLIRILIGCWIRPLNEWPAHRGEPPTHETQLINK